MKVLSKLLSYPSFTILSFIIFLFFDDPFLKIGNVLLPYSVYLFLKEDAFYEVANQKKYRLSFVRALIKLKKYFLRMGIKNYKFIVALILPVFLTLLLGAFENLAFLILGHITYLIDQKYLVK